MNKEKLAILHNNMYINQMNRVVYELKEKVEAMAHNLFKNCAIDVKIENGNIPAVVVCILKDNTYVQSAIPTLVAMRYSEKDLEYFLHDHLHRAMQVFSQEYFLK